MVEVNGCVRPRGSSHTKRDSLADRLAIGLAKRGGGRPLPPTTTPTVQSCASRKISEPCRPREPTTHTLTMATLEKSGGSGSSNNNNNNTDKKESTHNAQCSCCCYSSAQPINRANVFEDNVVLCVCVWWGWAGGWLTKHLYRSRIIHSERDRKRGPPALKGTPKTDTNTKHVVIVIA